MLSSFPSRRATPVADGTPRPARTPDPRLRRTLLRGASSLRSSLLASSASVLAFQPLPPGGQVNDDKAAGIDKTLSVSGEDPRQRRCRRRRADGRQAGGPVGGPAPDASRGGRSPRPDLRALVRGGAWTTRGSGTVGGRSSAAPQFSGSLNFDQEPGRRGALDRLRGQRTHRALGHLVREHERQRTSKTTTSSRAASTTRGDANQGKWIFGGQGRGTGGGAVPVPSLNIDTNQAAENPSVAGGSAVDPSKPGPWVTFQEFSGLEGVDQIFVERPIGPGAANCDGVKPAGVAVEGHVPAIGGFCWQQTGHPARRRPTRA